jgi:hypothetical protein
MPPMRLFSRDAGDTVVEPALQAPPPPPRSSPPVSPTREEASIYILNTDPNFIQNIIYLQYGGSIG